MTIKPTELFAQKLPDAINAALAEMKSLAAQGDEKSKQRCAELATVPPGATRVLLEGKGGADLYLVSEDGQFRAYEKLAAGVPVLLTVAVSADAVELGFEELERELEQALAFVRRRVVRLSPKKARALIDRVAAEQLRFHLVIKDTPDFDEVRVKIATGSPDAPAQPGFTVTVEYDTIEQLRAGKLKSQAAFSKLRLTGDAARAMQLGMELMQRPQ